MPLRRRWMCVLAVPLAVKKWLTCTSECFSFCQMNVDRNARIYRESASGLGKQLTISTPTRATSNDLHLPGICFLLTLVLVHCTACASSRLVFGRHGWPDCPPSTLLMFYLSACGYVYVGCHPHCANIQFLFAQKSGNCRGTRVSSTFAPYKFIQFHFRPMSHAT